MLWCAIHEVTNNWPSFVKIPGNLHTFLIHLIRGNPFKNKPALEVLQYFKTASLLLILALSLS